jgi:hypothetical protein
MTGPAARPLSPESAREASDGSASTLAGNVGQFSAADWQYAGEMAKPFVSRSARLDHLRPRAG